MIEIKLMVVQGEYYVPVRPNRGCFEAVIEVILKILRFFSYLKAFRVILIKRTFP